MLFLIPFFSLSSSSSFFCFLYILFSYLHSLLCMQCAFKSPPLSLLPLSLFFHFKVFLLFLLPLYPFFNFPFFYLLNIFQSLLYSLCFLSFISLMFSLLLDYSFSSLSRPPFLCSFLHFLVLFNSFLALFFFSLVVFLFFLSSLLFLHLFPLFPLHISFVTLFLFSFSSPFQPHFL